MKQLKKKILYYFWATYRRKMIDTLLSKYSTLYQGHVLDIGGRERGDFRPPKDQVLSWTTTDINADHTPDMVLDVAHMDQISSASIDVINAIELFEHVHEIELGLDECTRVLKNNGLLIISVPFMFWVHADPYDYQRWTEYKWRDALTARNFVIEDFEVMGRYCTVHADMVRMFIKALPRVLRYVLGIFLPILDLFVLLDKTNFIQKHKILGNCHGGYFIVARKSTE